MDAYLTVQLFQAGQLWSLGQAGLISEEETREWMLEEVDFYFSNTFAQTWWQLNDHNWSHLTSLDEAISSLDENQTKRDYETIQQLLKERASSAKDTN